MGKYVEFIESKGYYVNFEVTDQKENGMYPHNTSKVFTLSCYLYQTGIEDPLHIISVDSFKEGLEEMFLFIKNR